MIGTGPGGDDILDQGGDFLDQATAARMDDPTVGRDLLQLQQGLVDRALTWGHGRLSKRTRCKEGKAAAIGSLVLRTEVLAPTGGIRIFTKFFLNKQEMNSKVLK